MSQNYFNKLMDTYEELIKALGQTNSQVRKLSKLIRKDPKIAQRASEGINKLQDLMHDTLFTAIHEVKDEINAALS